MFCKQKEKIVDTFLSFSWKKNLKLCWIKILFQVQKLFKNVFIISYPFMWEFFVFLVSVDVLKYLLKLICYLFLRVFNVVLVIKFSDVLSFESNDDNKGIINFELWLILFFKKILFTEHFSYKKGLEYLKFNINLLRVQNALRFKNFFRIFQEQLFCQISIKTLNNLFILVLGFIHKFLILIKKVNKKNSHQYIFF